MTWQGIRNENDKATAAQAAKRDRERAEADAETLKSSQKTFAQAFAKSFSDLNTKVADLQTKAATEELRRELTQVRAELEGTQKALAPKPKARLTFSFSPFKNPPAGTGQSEPVTASTTARRADDSVHVTVAVLNNSDADAIDGAITIILCNGCRFAKEPKGFSKVEGTAENERNMQFTSLHRATASQDIGLDVIVDPHLANFNIGMVYRCSTCVVEPVAQKITARVVTFQRLQARPL
jgi:hypothetical protein